MKVYSLIATTAIAALALAGCNKENAAPATDPDAGTKTITVTINGASLTKAASAMTPDDAWGTGADIVKYDIYFTNTAGIIQYVYTIADGGTYDKQWDAFAAGRGVRFVGLNEVSEVYVVGNSSDSQTLVKGNNIETLTADIANYGGTKEKNAILYVGGDRALNPIGNEPADDVNDEDNVVEGEAEQASQYLTANIFLRPIISRLEIGAVRVEENGVSDPITVDGTQYVVKWSGFQPKLSGIYMSNVYGTVNPVVPSVANGFETPGGSQITNGLWNNDLGLTAGQNTDGVLLYSHYNSGYQDLFNPESGLEDPYYYYFKGYEGEAAATTCVPFNFFVPFDVEKDNSSVSYAPGIEGFYNPHFHFQFDFSEENDYTYTVYAASDTGYETPITDENIVAQLTSNINFNGTMTADNIFYANIVSFLNAGNEEVSVKSNTIYRIKDVTITPFNLTTSTEDEGGAFNIIVRVTEVDYVTEDVTPSFDHNQPAA